MCPIRYTITDIKERRIAMTDKDILKKIRKDLTSRKDRSAWNKGVTVYALELLDELQERVVNGWFDDLMNYKLTKKSLLNGAENWSEYSWGGCSLIYNEDIAERLSNPTELKRTDNGRKRPNPREEWLDTQARALYQASNRLMKSWTAVVYS